MSLVARPCSAVLACIVCLILSMADAGAAAKTFRYFRFVTTHPRDNPAVASSIQISEFQFIRNGAVVSTAGATVTNPGGNNPAGEGTANLLDSNLTTKWLDFNKRELLFTFPAPVTIDAYTFATANDAVERDPSNWKFLGSADGSTWTLLDDINGYSATDLRGTLQPRFYLPASVPPYSSFWHPAYLENWTPASDPNAVFNRSNVPLVARFAPTDAASPLNVNAHARPGEAKIATLSGFPTSRNPSQGTLVEHSNAMSFWQYTEDCVYFGGSAGEGLILAPSAPVIDAAHRNGVPVFGNVFFPPTAFGGRFAWVNDFLKKTGSTFPVADKMIEVANYYGFDGWFINQETVGGNSTTATAMKDFLLYLRAAGAAPEDHVVRRHERERWRRLAGPLQHAERLVHEGRREPGFPQHVHRLRVEPERDRRQPRPRAIVRNQSIRALCGRGIRHELIQPARSIGRRCFRKAARTRFPWDSTAWAAISRIPATPPSFTRTNPGSGPDLTGTRPTPPPPTRGKAWRTTCRPLHL